jgi:hypothetical protein
MPLSPQSRAELRARRHPAPPIPAMPACTRCGGIEAHYGWQQRRDGGWHIRVECGRCGRFVMFARQVEPFLTFANSTASETAVLDVLCQCDAQGIDLHSDGQTVRFVDPEDHPAPPRLRELVRQCSHDLAGLMGRQP